MIFLVYELLTTMPAFFIASGRPRSPVPMFPLRRWVSVCMNLRIKCHIRSTQRWGRGKKKKSPVYIKVINFKIQLTIYSGPDILKEVLHIQIMVLCILTCEHPQIEHTHKSDLHFFTPACEMLISQQFHSYFASESKLPSFISYFETYNIQNNHQPQVTILSAKALSKGKKSQNIYKLF